MEYLKNSSMSEKEQNKWASKIESSLKKDKLNDHTSYILMQKLQENLKASGVTAEDNKLGLHQMTADNVAGIDGESLAKSLVKADLSLFAPGKISEDRSQMLKNMKSGLAEMGAYAHVTAKSQETTVKVEGQFATLGELLIYDAYLPGKARKDGEPVTNNLLYNITYDADGKERTPEEASKLYEQAKNGKDAATDAYTQKSVNDALNPAAPVKDAQATGSVTLDVENVSASVAVTVELKSQVEWVNNLFKVQAADDYFNRIPNVDIQVPMSDGTTGPMNARAAVLEVIEQTAANEDVTAFGGQDMPIKDAYKLLMENKGGKALLEAACTQLGITVPQ
jgi:hypothetical protein